MPDLSHIVKLEGASTQDAKRLLAKWKKRARSNQLVHYARSAQLQRNHQVLGILIAALAAFVGTSIFVSLAVSAVDVAKYVVAGASILAAILMTMQTTLRWSEQAGAHHALACAYGALHRRMEQLLETSSEITEALLTDIRKDLDCLPHQGPSISRKLWTKTPKHLTPGDNDD